MTEKKKELEEVTKDLDAIGNKIQMIPIGKLRKFQWATGIRNQDVFDALKENIKAQGMNNPPVVLETEDGFYEPFIGDHRVQAARDLCWKEVPCIVRNVPIDKALEICLGDNINRANYSSIELEDRVGELYESGNYATQVGLGIAIGLTSERVGQILKARRIRAHDRETLNEKITTTNILDTHPLNDIEDKIAVLKRFKDDDNFGGKQIKKYSKELANMTKGLRTKILYEGMKIEEARRLTQSTQTNAKIEKKTRKTKTQLNPNLLPELYNTMIKLQDYVALSEGSVRENAFSYIKFCVGLQLEILVKENVMSQEEFETFVNEKLDIDINLLHKFDGTMDKGVNYFFDNTSQQQPKEPRVEEQIDKKV